MTDKLDKDIPLSNQDVSDIMLKISQLDSKTTNRIFIKYSQTFLSLMSIILERAKQTGDEDDIAELESMKRILGMVPVEDLFIRTHGKIWNVREHLLNKNKDYFFNRDYSHLIKPDKNQVFIETLVEIARTQSTTMTDAELLPYWRKTAELLKLIIEFKKALLNRV